jgi:hypothetical protein
MRDLLAVCRDARRTLESGEDTKEILRELLSWVESEPSPAEQTLAGQMGADPESWVAMSVWLQCSGGALAPTPQGEVLVLNYQLLVPAANLVLSRILLPGGQMSNPVDGMPPVLAGRWVLPRGKLRPEVLAALLARQVDHG